MNQNYNINFEFAKCLDPNDGNIGINIGLNYIFLRPYRMKSYTEDDFWSSSFLDFS